MGDRHSPAAASTSATDPEEEATNPGAKTVPGAESVYLWVGDGRVAVRCRVHPEFDEARPYNAEREVPAAWVVGVLARHLVQHNAPAEEPADEGEDTAVAFESAQPLDEFGREVAARCRWAMDNNAGDPDDKWPDQYRLAVALALLNMEYLRDMGDGLGYTPEQAMVLLVRGMTHRPDNIDAWFGAIRAAIRRPGERQALWLPFGAAPAQTRTGNL